MNPKRAHPDIGALESGLGVHLTKLGADNKEVAWACTKTRALLWVAGIFTCVVCLTLLVSVYAGLFNEERVQRDEDSKMAQQKMGDQKLESVRLNMAFHQQHAVREHQVSLINTSVLFLMDLFACAVNLC
jgi:hypothetical protein